MPRHDMQSEKFISLTRLFATLLIIGFVAETMIMFLLPVILPRVSEDWGAIADATLLTFISAPAIWYLVIRPLRRVALREKEQASAVIAHAVDGIMTLDDQGTVLSCNPAAETMFLYPADELVGRPLTLLIPEFAAERSSPRTWFDQLAVDFDKQHVPHGYVGRKKDGSELTIELSGSLVRLDGRKTLIAIVRDVTERRRVEVQLQKLNRAIEQSPSSVVITDSSGRIEYVNPKFTEVTGYSAAEALGKNLRLLNSGRQSREFYKDMWDTILQGREWRGEFCNRKKSGELYWEFSSISPIRNTAGQVTHFVSVKEDVTQRRQNEEELRQAKEAAEAANRAKSQFLASMSHELRTPLNGVLGYAQILQQDAAVTAEQRGYLNSIERCGTHLLTLINDVLDLSRIESGKVEVQMGRCDLSSLLLDVHDVVAPRAAEKNLHLLMDVAPQAPQLLLTDPVKLRQVLVNLLANALKFTDRGSVTLRVGLADHVAKKQLRFEVRDTGCGIPTAQLTDVFEPFTQVEEVGRAAGGTGLGLAISRRLAAALGGTLEVESEVGQGSCFTLSLPLLETTAVHASETLDESSNDTSCRVLAPDQDLTVLVADDNPTNRDLLVKLLQRSGIRSLQAASGEEAIAQLRRYRPRVALLDAHMPVLDGVETIKMIRGDEDLRDTILILVSADVLTDFRQRLGDVRWDDFISKPVRLAELLDKIARHAQVDFLDQAAPAPITIANEDRSQLPIEMARRVANRLQSAAEINSVTELNSLAAECLTQPDPVRQLGLTIARLAQDFDFSGVACLATSLEESATVKQVTTKDDA